jgi:hypothetical protein
MPRPLHESAQIQSTSVVPFVCLELNQLVPEYLHGGAMEDLEAALT